MVSAVKPEKEGGCENRDGDAAIAATTRTTGAVVRGWGCVECAVAKEGEEAAAEVGSSNTICPPQHPIIIAEPKSPQVTHHWFPSDIDTAPIPTLTLHPITPHIPSGTSTHITLTTSLTTLTMSYTAYTSTLSTPSKISSHVTTTAILLTAVSDILPATATFSITTT